MMIGSFHKNIFRFQVTMSNTTTMQLLNSFGDLLDAEQSLFFGHTMVLTCIQHIPKRSSTAILHDVNNDFGVIDDVEDTQNMLTLDFAKFLVNFLFSDEILRGAGIFLYNPYCKRVFEIGVVDAVYFGEIAGASELCLGQIEFLFEVRGEYDHFQLSCKYCRQLQILFVMKQDPQEHKEAPKQKQVKQQAGAVKLHYFSIRGNCQPVRNLLHYLAIPFQDVFHIKSEETQKDCGFNIGLPQLEEGDHKIYDTIAIMLYICKRENKMSLIGLTPQNSARINEALFKYSNQRKKIMNTILEGVLKSLQSQQEHGDFVTRLLTKLSDQCKFVDYCIKSLQKRKYVLDELTVVDFIFYEICFYIVGFFGNSIEANSDNHAIVKFKEHFELLSFYEKNRQKIESVPLFFQFSRPEFNSRIENSWKGNKIPLINKSNL